MYFGSGSIKHMALPCPMLSLFGFHEVAESSTMAPARVAAGFCSRPFLCMFTHDARRVPRSSHTAEPSSPPVVGCPPGCWLHRRLPAALALQRSSFAGGRRRPPRRRGPQRQRQQRHRSEPPALPRRVRVRGRQPPRPPALSRLVGVLFSFRLAPKDRISVP